MRRVAGYSSFCGMSFLAWKLFSKFENQSFALVGGVNANRIFL